MPVEEEIVLEIDDEKKLFEDIVDELWVVAALLEDHSCSSKVWSGGKLVVPSWLVVDDVEAENPDELDVVTEHHYQDHYHTFKRY